MTVEEVREGAVADALRDRFLGWQCRLRQLAVRRFGGRPSPGMRPRVLDAGGAELAASIIVLLLPREPAEATAQFRHMVRRSHDPRERHGAALKYLQATHYQYPHEFSDRPTALFAADSRLAATLAAAGRCVLDFREASQSYRVPCAVAPLAPEAEAWQATYWHNAMFNHNLPRDVTVLGFTPDWSAAEVEPPLPPPTG